MGMQSLLRLIYPPRCLSCETLVASDFGLCPQCWRETPFITGLVCDACGAPQPGEVETGPAGAGRAAGPRVLCDDCLRQGRPWTRGRAAFLYRDKGRSLTLALKHGDRLDLAAPASRWMARAAAGIVDPKMLVAPVPLHWRRLVARRYNQAAQLSRPLAATLQLAHCPDLLIRARATPSQEGRDRDGRFANLDQAIAVRPGARARMRGRPVLLVDDVMTSGATLAAAAAACRGAGSGPVSVVVLARVAPEA